MLSANGGARCPGALLARGGPRPRPGSEAPSQAPGPGRARPYLFQVALAQARRCCVPRSSAAAAAVSLLPRSLRLGELMNFNLRRVLMVTPVARSAATRSLRHATPRARRCALYKETWAGAGSRTARRGPAPAPRLRPGPPAGRPAGLIIAPSGCSAHGPGSLRH